MSNTTRPSLVAQVLRHAGPLKKLRGFHRIVDALVPLRGGELKRFDVPFYGSRHQGSFESHIDRQVYFYGAYEKPEIEFVRRWVSDHPARRRVAIDVGANVGHHALAFAGMFDVVHSFEPNGPVADQLAARMATNSVANVVIHRFGLWNENKTLTFNIPPEHLSGLGSFKEDFLIPGEQRRTASLEVRHGARFLNGEGIDQIDLLKVDVQGAERAVLIGLRDIVSRCRPLVWAEISGAARKELSTIGSLYDAIGFQPSKLVAFLPTGSRYTTRLACREITAADYERHDGNLLMVP